jgi:Tfp pilus assembly protein PilN
MNMLRFHLNFATNPFVNYRKYYLAGVLLLAVGGVGAVYSVEHYRTLHQSNQALTEDLAANQKELNQLIERQGHLKEQLEQPQTLDEVDRINFYNTLIQRRTFPWTQFFRDLEAVIPYNVQVTEIRQKAGGKGLDLEMVYLGRTTADAVNFLRNLSNSKKFRNILVNQEGSFREAATHRVSNEIEVTLHLQYEP